MSIRIPPIKLAYALILFLLICHASSPAQQPSAVPVHYVQGASHAFLTVRAESGAVLGYGELLRLIHGDRVTSHLTYHFRDGSIDDDITVFSQRASFHLISDHHVQHGPFFSKATDFSVDGTGNVTIRTVKGDGKESTETNHIDLPPNVSNGFTGTMLLNVAPSSAPFKLGLVAPTGKGRLIQLSITVEGEESFTPVGESVGRPRYSASIQSLAALPGLSLQ
jgi:hypothetical protein